MTMNEDLPRTEEEWERRLDADGFRVLRRRGTESPFTGRYHDHHGDGVYRCAGCGEELFDSRSKFDSGTGWPSFDAPLPGKVEEEPDHSHGMRRTEVHCSNCGGHLGHVFPDGPTATGRRYCLNSTSLRFQER
ncbi:MAG: peptide-methionine (R)-S-oxide reductase MsrB [Candidatus Methanomethylophilaceae archaeon]